MKTLAEHRPEITDRAKPGNNRPDIHRQHMQGESRETMCRTWHRNIDRAADVHIAGFCHLKRFSGEVGLQDVVIFKK